MEEKIITPDTKIRFNTLLLTKDGIKFVVPNPMTELDTDTYLPTNIACRSGDFLRNFYKLIQEDIQNLPNDLRPLLYPLLPFFKTIANIKEAISSHGIAQMFLHDTAEALLNSETYKDGFRKLDIPDHEAIEYLSKICTSCFEMCKLDFNAGFTTSNYNINMHFTGFENEHYFGLGQENKHFHLLYNFAGFSRSRRGYSEHTVRIYNNDSNSYVERTVENYHTLSDKSLGAKKFPVNFATKNGVPYNKLPGANEFSLDTYLKGIHSVNSIDSYNNLVDLVYSVNLYCTLLDNGSIVINKETGEITPGIVHKDGNEFAIGRSIMRMIKNLTMPRDYFSNLDEETTNYLTNCFMALDFWQVGSDSHNKFIEIIRPIIVKFRNINPETCDAIIGEARARVRQLSFDQSMGLEDIFEYIVAGVNENLGLNYTDFFEDPDNATRPIPHETRVDMKYFEPMYLYQAAITMVLLHFRNHDQSARDQILDNILKLNEKLSDPNFEPPNLENDSIISWVIKQISSYNIEYRKWFILKREESQKLDENEIIKLTVGAQQIFEAILGNNHPTDITFHNFREGDESLDPQRKGKEYIPHIVYIKSGNAAVYLVSNLLIEAKRKFFCSETKFPKIFKQVFGFDMNEIKNALLQIEGKYRSNNTSEKIKKWQNITKEMTESGSFMISEDDLRRNLPKKEQVEAIVNKINTKYPEISLKKNLSNRFVNKDTLQEFLNNIDAQLFIDNDRFDENSISFIEMLKAFTVEQLVEFEDITVKNGENTEPIKMLQILYEKYREYFVNETREIIADEERICELCPIHFILSDDTELINIRKQFATKLQPWQVKSIRQVLKYHGKNEPEVQRLHKQVETLTAAEINTWTAEQLQPFERFYISLAEITHKNCCELKPMHLKLLSTEERNYINDKFGNSLTFEQKNTMRIFAGEVPIQSERPNCFVMAWFWIKYLVIKILYFIKIISTDPEPLCPTNLFRQPLASDAQNNEQETNERLTVAQRLEEANNTQENLNAPISQTYENGNR